MTDLLLQEDGDAILQEDGSFILLEDSMASEFVNGQVIGLLLNYTYSGIEDVVIPPDEEPPPTNLDTGLTDIYPFYQAAIRASFRK